MFNIEEYILKCVVHKFDGMQYFMPPNSFYIYDYLENIKDDLDSYLLEGTLYENDKCHFFMTKNHQKFLNKLSKNDYSIKKHSSPKNISFSFIYNNREQYRQHLESAYNHYSNLNLPFKTEIVVYDENEENFDMARARNKSLEKCNFDYVFMLDLDCYLSAEEILRIIKIWDEKKHCGVFNLKPSYTSGNGLWFGKKEVFMKNKYSEKFKKFWCEDTEFFLNFSRIGILPMVIFCNSKVVEHSRKYTNNFVNLNHEIFRDIFQGIQER